MFAAEGANGYASMSYEVCFNGDCEVFSGQDLPEYPPAGGGVSYSRSVRLPRHDYIEFTFVFESPSSSDSTPSYPLRVGDGSRKTYELKNGDAWSLKIVRADDSVFYEESVTATYEQRRFRFGDFANVEASCNTLAK